MKKQPQADPNMQKLADLIAEAGIAMLATTEPDGTLRSRPLATLEMDSEGKLWFFTAMSSGKVSEIDQHRKVNLSYVNLDKQDYVSVSGHARLFRDPEKMRELWTPWVEPWFPEGLDDPDLGLLEVTVDDAEYWDAPASKTQRLFGLAKALTSGKADRLGEHAKVHPRQ
ncbi:MAG: Pyridoxamine 5-phosphate oxidase-related, FMN-binding protein [Gammaproteobacteria bacterium]|jgi:general stress protein 26|nr:Pyridoxamine 5-phosphate oxidase-related, FMN-binding protein [Gammaproteobacteria bacterium]